MTIRRVALAVGAVTVLAACLPASVAAVAPPGPAAAEDGSRGQARAALVAARRHVSLVGHHNLGGGGLNGDVAVVGNTAVVGAGLVPFTGYHTERYNPLPCFTVSAKVVSVRNPRRPQLLATIPLPAGVAAIDVDALRVRTRSFRGVLAAIALDDGPSQQGPTGCVPTAANPGPTFVDRGIVYYDISSPRSPQLLGRYQADADAVPAGTAPCGPPPGGSPVSCATGQHSVDLVQRGRRLLSVSVEPAASQGANIRPSGDVRIVDVTDPRSPRQVGAFPPLGQRPHPFANNGCSPFVNGHSAEFAPGGRSALAAYMDEGLYHLDLANPAAPRLLGKASYPPTRELEGNAAYATSARVGRRRLALVSEDDWLGTETRLRIDSPAALAGSKFACEGMFTFFDIEGDSQIYRRPDRQLAGDIVYVGRGCVAAGTSPADPYLADPRGKIAFIDSARVPATQPGIPASGPNCRFENRVRRAQAAGATAALFGRVPNPPFANDPRAVTPGGGGPTGMTIPAVQIDKDDADALRSTLCPGVSGGACTGGQAVSGALVATPGEWGALRVADLRRATRPRFVSSYRTRRARAFPPPDLGIYAPGHAEVEDERAYVAWNADGLRVIDLSRRRLREVGAFVPRDAADPTGTLPPKAQVVGVAFTRRHVVITDVNSGLYVLSHRARGQRRR